MFFDDGVESTLELINIYLLLIIQQSKELLVGKIELPWFAPKTNFLLPDIGSKIRPYLFNPTPYFFQ